MGLAQKGKLIPDSCWDVKFLEPESYQPLARKVFDLVSETVRQALPNARIEHIGSSAIEGALSKGDLDVFVGVDRADFEGAIAAVASLGFQVKAGSFRSDSLCPFESVAYPLPLGLQLVANASEFEFFVKFRDRMNSDPALRMAYNELKLGSSMLDEHEYRRIKSTFIERVLGELRLTDGT